MNRIREIRESKKMTQEELAKAAGCSRVTIVTLEHSNSNTTLKTLFAIAKALGVSARELILPDNV